MGVVGSGRSGSSPQRAWYRLLCLHQNAPSRRSSGSPNKAPPPSADQRRQCRDLRAQFARRPSGGHRTPGDEDCPW